MPGCTNITTTPEPPRAIHTVLEKIAKQMVKDRTRKLLMNRPIYAILNREHLEESLEETANEQWQEYLIEARAALKVIHEIGV